jgi:hypothetical protein
MAFDANIIKLINDFSKPITKGNWRESRVPFSKYELNYLIYKKQNYECECCCKELTYKEHLYSIYICDTCYNSQYVVACILCIIIASVYSTFQNNTSPPPV